MGNNTYAFFFLLPSRAHNNRAADVLPAFCSINGQLGAILVNQSYVFILQLKNLINREKEFYILLAFYKQQCESQSFQYTNRNLTS